MGIPTVYHRGKSPIRMCTYLQIMNLHVPNTDPLLLLPSPNIRVVDITVILGKDEVV